jgi:hydrogenase small subunit
MLSPSLSPPTEGSDLRAFLEQRGVGRRDFLTFCTQVSIALGIGEAAAPQVAKALETAKRPPVLWLQLQECTGCVESVTRTSEPTIGDLVLDVISLDYSHTLMAASGTAAESAFQKSMKDNKGKYLLIVTGSVPLKDNGIYLTVGGRTAHELLTEAAKDAAAVVALGACAHWGNIQASRPNPTGAVGVSSIVTDKPVVNIAGCPPIGDVVTATVVHFLTFGRLPELDGDGRPVFAYGKRIHDQCSRRAHFDAGQYVEKFDDDGARRGWCLYKVGCKGPATYSPCPIFQWNGHTSWPIGAGHPCLGCTERGFWDAMTPFYGRLPADVVGGFGVERYADTIGAAVAAGAVAGIATHAIATGVYQVRKRKQEAPAQEQPQQKGDGNGQD